MKHKNFIIIIGGPRLFVKCDPEHDKTWKNFLVPMQVATLDNLYQKQVNETVHWFVYEPAYKNRWDDDSEISWSEMFHRYWGGDDELHKTREKAAKKVVSDGAQNYLVRIKQFAGNHQIGYHGLQSVADLWSEIGKMADSSISRIWYSGHAAEVGLMLSLTHNLQSCGEPFGDAVIRIGDILARKNILDKKIDKASKSYSEFFGCNTSTLAKVWHETFGVPTAGAKNKITFAAISQGFTTKNILERLKTTHTTSGAPLWTTFE